MHTNFTLINLLSYSTAYRWIFNLINRNRYLEWQATHTHTTPLTQHISFHLIIIIAEIQFNFQVILNAALIRWEIIAKSHSLSNSKLYTKLESILYFVFDSTQFCYFANFAFNATRFNNSLFKLDEIRWICFFFIFFCTCFCAHWNVIANRQVWHCEIV